MPYRKIHWTEHVQAKMRQYALSKTKLLNLLNQPERKEQGIAPETVAVMKSNKSYSRAKIQRVAGEVWLMYVDSGDVRKIISAWRYPGISKPGQAIPIPDQIREELASITD